MPKKKTTTKTAAKKTAKKTAAKQPARTSGATFGPIERLAVAELTPDPNNARTHDAANLAAIEASLRANGQYRPAIVNLTEDGQKIVVVGNGMLAAAQKIGWEWLECRTCRLSPAQQRAISVADNRTAELADWDMEVLESLLEPMRDDTPDLADALLFEKLLPAAKPDTDEGAEPQTDRAEELQAEWKTEVGQLWEIVGENQTHRLLCGDSTQAEDVERLMDRERAQLMNTDPPYGVTYANDERPNPGVAKPRVANDTLTDAQLQAFLESCFRAAVAHALLPNAAWYMWHAHLTQGYFAAAAAAAAANVVLHRQIIWVKPVLLLGRGQYHWKHEPCFMGWVKGNQPPDYGEGNGERTQTTVWELPTVTQAERKEFNHSTPKPIKLFTIPLVKHTKPGEIAYEPFAGSGPQFIAAEQLGRRCYGMEISPAYCAVILQRCVDNGMEPHLAGTPAAE